MAKKKKKKLVLGKLYTKKKNLPYRKKLTKKESKKYTKLEKKAKKVVQKANKTLQKKIKKLKKGGLTKKEQKKVKKLIKQVKKKTKKNKSIKAINKYKKKLDKKYSKKKKKASKKERKRIQNTLKSKAPNNAYIINDSNNETYVFQFNPEKVPYEYKASYNSIDSPGQCYPLTQYSKGDAMEFDVELFLYVPALNGSGRPINIGGVFSDASSIKRSINADKYDDKTKGRSPKGNFEAINNDILLARNFLKKLLPRTNGVKPPTCTFAFGYFVETCVLTSLKVEDERLDSKGVPIQTKFTLGLRKV